MYSKASYEAAQARMQRQRRAVHHPLYKLAERGRRSAWQQMTPAAYAAWKREMVGQLMHRWMSMEGLDRQIQEDALLRVLQDEPVTFSILTARELETQTLRHLKACATLLRHYKATRGWD